MWVCPPLVAMVLESCIRTPVMEVCLDWVIAWAGPLGSAVTYSEGALDMATILRVLTDSCMYSTMSVQFIMHVHVHPLSVDWY